MTILCILSQPVIISSCVSPFLQTHTSLALILRRCIFLETGPPFYILMLELGDKVFPSMYIQKGKQVICLWLWIMRGRRYLKCPGALISEGQSNTVSCFSLALSWLIWPWNLCLSEPGSYVKDCYWDFDQTRLTLPVLPTVSSTTQTETWCKDDAAPGVGCCTLSNMELASFRRSVISFGGRLGRWTVHGEEMPWGHGAGGGSLSGSGTR